MLRTRHTDVVGDSNGRSYVTEQGHNVPLLRTRGLGYTFGDGQRERERERERERQTERERERERQTDRHFFLKHVFTFEQH